MGVRIPDFVIALILAVSLGGAAHGQSFNKKKPKTTAQVLQVQDTGVGIPGEPYGKYVWRQVYTCNAKWFSDGQLKSCEGIDGTTRWRLETNGDFAERVIWDPGAGEEPGSDLLNATTLGVLENGAVTLVALPSGKQTKTAYSQWVYMSGWLVSDGWYLIGPKVAGQPRTVSKLNDDGSVDAPVPHADFNRFVETSSADDSCYAPAYSATMAVEFRVRGEGFLSWSKLRRMALEDDGSVTEGSLSSDGDASERCHRYQRQFFLAQDKSDATWSILGLNGKVYSPAPYTTAELAAAAAPGVWANAAEAQAVADVEDAERAARTAAQAVADAEAARAKQEQDYADARARANALLKQGRYQEAVDAGWNLPVDEWPSYVLAWHEAPLALYKKSVDRILRQRETGEGWSSRMLDPLEERVKAIEVCTLTYAQPSGGSGGQKWLSRGSSQRWLDMNALKQGIDVTEHRDRGMHLAFDATAYEWVWVNNGVADIINIPSSEPLPVDTAGLEACYAKARAEN